MHALLDLSLDLDLEDDWSTELAWTEKPGAVLAGLDGHDLAVGHDGNVASPVALLCCSLAADLDGQIRLAALDAGVELASLGVVVTGDHRNPVVGLESMRVLVALRLRNGPSFPEAWRLVGKARQRSLVLNTLKAAVPLEVIVEEL